MVNIYERVRKAQAKAERDKKLTEYKAGEHVRRSTAARFAAQARKDDRIDAVIDGRITPKTRLEFEALERCERE